MLLKRLQTDRSLAAFAGQFVPLKLTTDGNAEWSKWSRQYPHQGRTVPIVYVIRADGEKLYASSGGLEGRALPRMLLTSLQQAGRTFNDVETNLLAKAVSEAERALKSDDLIGAATAFKSLKSLGNLGDLKSYSELAMQASQLAKKIASSGTELLEDAASFSELSSLDAAEASEYLRHAMTLVSAADAFDAFPELKATATQALRTAERNEVVSPLLTQARALIRARGYAESDSARLKRSAIKSYEQILQRYPNASVSDIARKELAELDPDSEALGQTPGPPSAPPKAGSFRTWTDSTGQYKTIAKLISIRQDVVILAREDGERLELPLARLSSEDRKYVQQLRASDTP